MTSSPREDGFIRLGGEFVFSFEREDLTEEFRELASRELRETPEIREQALRKLKELIKEEKNLYFPPHRDDFHLLWLRSNHFYPEGAMKKIKKYYTFKFNHPKLCTNILPSTVKNAFSSGVVSGLPTRDRHGRRVLILRPGPNWDPETCNVYEIIRAVVIVVKMGVNEPKSQVAGAACICDIEGTQLNQAMHVSPRTAHMVLTMLQECLAVKLSAVHVVNQASAVDMMYGIFKPFTKKKFRKMLHFHGTDREKLIEDIGAKCLPVRYGGQSEVPDLPGPELWELFCHYEEEYKELSTYGYTKKPSRKSLLFKKKSTTES